MMGLDDVRETQRQTWNRFAPGWKKWDDTTMAGLKPIGEELIRMAVLREGHRVLDVATGTGEPGLTAARLVGRGHVIGTDLAEEMVKVAQEKAQALGITNYEARAVDGRSLPFGDGEFDAVLCRHGVMFFPDIAAGLREFVRVVKRGGRVAISSWGPPAGNPWATVTIEVVGKMLGVAHPAPDAPGLFRCADPAGLRALLEGAGLRQVEVAEQAGAWRFDTVESYWGFMTDVVAPVVAALGQASAETREQVRQAVVGAARAYVRNGQVVFPSSAWVTVGVR